ncbi:MAG: 50S ribosomal protein L22 [Clostridia bacterium]|jgi:large subunit ribosomal protein L22|nr:50S ribosomal protein L22 [Clostridia bacterium]
MATRVREKSARRIENKDRRPKAVAKYIRISPTKVRLLINLIRGKSVREAKAIIMNTPKAASEPVLKLLNSAVANAENNLELNRDNLYVAETYVDQGPTLKRYQAGSRGRAMPQLKRSSHITIILDEVKEG